MHHFTFPSRIFVRNLFALAALGILPAAAWAFESGSTGADGELNPAVNTEIELPPSGILNYTTINIPAGVVVTFKKNQANTPVHLLASGNVTIAGRIDIQGRDGKDVGTYGNGQIGDDGIPGEGGPGGFDGGRGGRPDPALKPEIVRGGTGLGPGGGPGGIEGNDGCVNQRYYQYIGTGGAYATNAWPLRATYQCGAQYPALAKSYGSPLLQPLIGGSGGGGGRGGVNYHGSGGGGGGGAILIASSGTLSVTGIIYAFGGDSGGASGTGGGGSGGGGSGGAIRLVATTVAGNGTLHAGGGCLRYNNLSRQYCGSSGSHNQYGGADGRIRVEGEAITYSGTSTPSYVSGTPGPVFIAGAPSLRIASVNGVSVPPNPKGVADVTLPEAAAGPVEVVFETSNVPVGNTVLLRLVPAYGQPVEVLSPAISGSTASGTATVTVSLPKGPSTMQATTTYTVVLAMGEALSQYAQNERVEKVQITVAMAGKTMARLITVSGKEFDVPYSVLQEAGFLG